MLTLSNTRSLRALLLSPSHPHIPISLPPYADESLVRSSYGTLKLFPNVFNPHSLP
jgi:hypothetical protein